MGFSVDRRFSWFVGWLVRRGRIPFLPDIVAGALVFALLLWMTGLHHTDGLLDFGDGVMAHGTPEHKIDVMHDQLTGAGGLSLGILYDAYYGFSVWVAERFSGKMECSLDCFQQ